MLLILCLMSSLCLGRDIYVRAESQATGANGSEALPFRTIGEALSIVDDGDTVIVGGGVYHELVQVPGGRADAVVSLRAADGERVIISGAVGVTAWEQYDGGVYTTLLDFRPKRLLVAYREQPMAREPNEGWWTAQAADDLTLTDAVHLGDVSPDFVGGQAYLWTVYGNAFFDVPVTSLDRTNGRLTVVRESKWMQLGEGDRYFLQNHPSLIDSPGEWSVVEENGKYRVYFLPAYVGDLAEVMIPRETRALVSVSDASHVRISGLEVFGTTRNGVEIMRSADVVISDCVVHNHGYMGMLLRDVRDVAVRHSVFVVNSYGLVLHGANGAVIEENEIARNTTDGLIISWDSSDIAVCRNYIHHHLLWGHPDNIQLYRNVKDISFIDNLLLGSGQSMMMSGSSDGLIQGNMIVGAVSYSLVVEVDNFRIHNNTIAFSGYGSINLTGRDCDVRENVLVTGHPRTILSTRGSDGYSGDNNLFYNSRRSTDRRVVASEEGWHRSLVEYQRATGQDRSSAYGDPKFLNAPVCFAVVGTRSVADCTRDTLPLGSDALSFKVGDNIEIDFDGVLRKVIGRTAATITFSPALQARPMKSVVVGNWLDKHDLSLDLRLGPDSPGVELSTSAGLVGSSVGLLAYQMGDFDGDGKRDLPQIPVELQEPSGGQ